ncbi:MAG: hypothetical protein FWG55_05410 [Candidatus Bathyarchaeota archaeon]|nr:hypothetical protein [Candidatus Termiticorpusculum sp.]
MRRKLFAVIVVVLLLVGSVVVTSYVVLSQEVQKPFFVGVTHWGYSVQEAKDRIDQVKDYTNLFITQGGEIFWGNIEAMDEIGEYAIASNLTYAVAVSATIAAPRLVDWAVEAKERWGEQFLGIYFNDEPGGHMLDGQAILEMTYQPAINSMGISIQKMPGGIIMTQSDNGRTYYKPSGEINTQPAFSPIDVTYYTNGTITANVFNSDYERSDFYTSENITKCPYPIPLYEEVLAQNPIQNYDDAANAYVNMNRELLESTCKTLLSENSAVVFTADYGLYWWDYQSGYDLVLAELGWNNSITQELGLVRGAANLQNKQWGTILTWKYDQAPYLPDGEEMFEQMKTSYEAGADYVVIFNYSEDPRNPNTLQGEHFQALERFWNDVVQNPKIKHGGIKAEAVLVLPQNYGWGMRHSNDNIWGIWQPDNTLQQIWTQLQNKIDQYGLKLDIVFEDPSHSTTWKYSNIYCWNQK